MLVSENNHLLFLFFLSLLKLPSHMSVVKFMMIGGSESFLGGRGVEVDCFLATIIHPFS